MSDMKPIDDRKGVDDKFDDAEDKKTIHKAGESVESPLINA